MKTIRRFSARQATTVWWIVFWIGTWGTVLGADAGLTLLGEWPGYSRGPAKE